jgi:hypothetical protein
MAKNKNFQQTKNAINKKDKDNESKSKSQVTNPLAVALIALIAVALVATLNPSAGQQQQEGVTIGSYRGESIVFTEGSDYDSAARSIFLDYQERFGNDPSMVSFFIEPAYRQAFNQVVMNKHFRNLAERNNISASEHRIKEEVKKLPRFRVGDGFSEREYNLSSQETKLAIFDALERDYAVQTIQNVLFFGNAINPSLVELINNQSKNQRRIEYVVYEDADFPVESLESYAEENSDLFRTVELSKITILEGLDKAQEVLEIINQGDLTFGEVATAYSQDNFAASQGALGLKYSYEVEGELPGEEDLTTLLGLTQGDVSPIFETFTGYAIYRLESEVLPMNFEDSATQEKVKSYLRSREAGLYSDTLQQLARERQEAGVWNADALGKEIQDSGFFAVNVDGFENIDGIQNSESSTVLSGMQTPEFYSAVFEAEIGSILEPIITNQNTILLARVVQEQQLEVVEKDAEITRSVFGNRELSYQEQIMNSDAVVNQFDEAWDILSQALLVNNN